MATDRSRLTVDAGLDTSLVRTELETAHISPLFHAQKPYRNGITVYAKSVWGGNGFGNDIARVAVRDGVVVAVYESALFHQIARVTGAGTLTSDGELCGHGANRRRLVTKTALSKWIEAVKAL